jgi:hypothetical protein
MEEDLFSDSDDELAQKLMREVMPGNYVNIRKRRGELFSMTKQLNSTNDFSLRAAQKLVRNSFGIKKLDPREMREPRNSRYRDPLGRETKDQLKLISFCFGTAPQQFKLDIPEVNQKIMHMFE